MAPFLDYFGGGKLEMDKIEGRMTKYQNLTYTLIDGDLYKKSYTNPLLRCLTKIEVKEALREVHDRIFGDHIVQPIIHEGICRAKSLAYKLIW